MERSADQVTQPNQTDDTLYPMKKEILKTLSYRTITEADTPAPLPARATLEYLQTLYDALPAKLKNHKEILVNFDNRNEEISLYYLRELEPGEQPDPTPPQPAAATSIIDSTAEPVHTHIENDDVDTPRPRPRPYMRNFDPDYKRPDFDMS